MLHARESDANSVSISTPCLWKLKKYAVFGKELKRTADEAACAARLAELRAEDGLAGRLNLRANDAPADTDFRIRRYHCHACSAG